MRDGGGQTNYWIPEHFRRADGRAWQAALRLLLALVSTVAAYVHILAGQSPALQLALVILCALFAWSVPTPVAVYSTIWLGFVVLRGYADDLGLPDRGAAVADLDRWLAAGVTPTERLQQWLMTPDDLGLLGIAMVAVHASFFVVPHLTALALWWYGNRIKDLSLLWRFHHHLLTIMVIGLLFFALLPTSPPWLHATHEEAESMLVYRIVDGSWFSGSAGQSDQVYSTITDPNPIAAMPSLHLAVSLAVAAILWQLDRRLGIFGIVYAAAMGFALIYLGEHYLSDVLAGAIITLLAIPLARLWSRDFRRLVAPLLPDVAGRKVHPSLGRRGQSEAAD